jgi:hypothetical protein
VELSPSAAANIVAAFFIHTSADSFGNGELFDSPCRILPSVIAHSLIPVTFLKEETLLCSGLRL